MLPDQNLTQAMQMVGCDPGWLSAVVTENTIPIDQLGRLTFGSVYAMPAGVDCRTPAPAPVAALSKAMTATRTVSARATSLSSTVRTLEDRIGALEAELATTKASAERALADGRACIDAKVGVDASLVAVTQERDSLRAELAARWSASSGVVFGILLSTVVCVGWFLVRRFRA